MKTISQRMLALGILSLAVAAAVGISRVDAGDDHDHEGHDHGKMEKAADHDSHGQAKMQEGPVDVGEKAPDFTLTDLEGKTHTLSDYVKAGHTVVLEWFNPDCPFVQKHHIKFDSMKETFKTAKGKNVVWLAINSNAPGKQGSGLERNQKAREEFGITYPILLDETGAVGKIYGAKTTPHMYVIHEGALVFRGPPDNDSTPQKVGDTNYVIDALNASMNGKAVKVSEEKPYGCSVKYAS